MSRALLVILIILDGSPGQQEARSKLTKPVLDFSAAAKPYVGEKYELNGYVDAQGKVKNGGLGCSAYVSVVLHRMRDGEKWLEHFEWKLYQLAGDKIAAHFGLALTTSIKADTILDKPATAQLVQDGTLKDNQLYIFTVQKDPHGHVGFLRVKKDGELIQSHYSGLEPHNGLAAGDFRVWFKKSLYRAEAVSLFAVPEKE